MLKIYSCERNVMNDKKINLPMDITVIVLFMSFLLAGYIFICTDAEYNMNQQIARGYIGRDAVFFEFDDPSHNEAFFLASVDEQTVEYGGDASDPDFVLTNKVLDDGETAVEKLLSSYDGSYFSALHRGTMRGVYHRGDVLTPPVIEGRFFTEAECLSDKPLAVIGREYEDQVYKENGTELIDYLGKKYEVAGKAGLSGSSALDSIIFVNLGSLTPEEQLDGIYYFDSAFSNENVYKKAESMADELFGCGLKLHDMPMAFIDVVAGGMYMKTYLKVILSILMLLAFNNVMTQYNNRQKMKISVMKLCSVSYSGIFRSVCKNYIIDCLIGISLGSLILLALIYFRIFSLPVNYIIQVTAGLLLAAFGIFVAGLISSGTVILRNKPGEMVNKI